MLRGRSRTSTVGAVGHLSPGLDIRACAAGNAQDHAGRIGERSLGKLDSSGRRVRWQRSDGGSRRGTPMGDTS